MTTKKLIIAALLMLSMGSFAQVGINTTMPNASAMLDVVSTNKGLLPPRMTTDQRNAIASPAAGLVIFNTTTNCINFYTSSGWNESCGSLACGNTITHNGLTYNSVQSTTGKCWLDRNLGATQVATSSTDANSYGDLYQWGRLTDGHQIRTSGITATLSSTDVPGNANFITAPNSPNDWRSGQNGNLWQGVNGTNNPCPTGYRVPTSAELDAERALFIPQNAAGAIASVLKLPLAGYRRSDGSLSDEGSIGDYWSSTVGGAKATYLGFDSNIASTVASYDRAGGFSVRCLKN